MRNTNLRILLVYLCREHCGPYRIRIQRCQCLTRLIESPEFAKDLRVLEARLKRSNFNNAIRAKAVNDRAFVEITSLIADNSTAAGMNEVTTSMVVAIHPQVNFELDEQIRAVATKIRRQLTPPIFRDDAASV